MSISDDPAGRFKLVQQPSLSPGACFVTKTDKGPFIDTGINLALVARGRAYLSVAALREMAEVAGLLTQDPGAVPLDQYKEDLNKAREMGREEALREHAALADLSAVLVDHAEHVRSLLGPAPLAEQSGAQTPPASGDGEPEESGVRLLPRNVEP